MVAASPTVMSFLTLLILRRMRLDFRQDYPSGPVVVETAESGQPQPARALPSVRAAPAVVDFVNDRLPLYVASRPPRLPN
jgi:hypothetical protein